MLLFILFSVLVGILLYLYSQFERSERLIKKIPGPKSLPIVGNLFNYFLPPEKLFLFHRSLNKLYGHVSQIHGFNMRIVHVSNPEDIEKLLSASLGNHKEHPYNYLKFWVNQGLVLINDPRAGSHLQQISLAIQRGNAASILGTLPRCSDIDEAYECKSWSERRKLLTKAFHYNILQKFTLTFDEESEHFIDSVYEEVGKEKTELFHMLSNTTLRIMCATTMGMSSEDLKSLAHEYLSSLEVIGECFARRLGSAWMHYEPLYQLSETGKKQNRAKDSLHSLTNKVIKNRQAYLAERNFNHFDHDDSYESNEKLAMIDLLLKNEKAGVIDHKAVREEVDTFMFAGHDTTATAMTYMIMALANEPEIQDKIYEEIRLITGDSARPLTMDELNQLKYLECCIKESLRLYPSAPLIGRHLLKDTVLGGYTVPAKTEALILIYDMHRRADLFPEPERFIPERFLPENSAKRHPYAYIPFSAGPRNCIGQKFAMLQMKTVMAKLLRKFRFLPVTKPEDIVYRSDIVLRTTQPVYAKFAAR